MNKTSSIGTGIKGPRDRGSKGREAKAPTPPRTITQSELGQVGGGTAGGRELKRAEACFDRWQKFEVERLGIVHRECDEHPDVQQRRLEVIVAEQERIYRDVGRRLFMQIAEARGVEVGIRYS
jgi:hypothetical protein